MLRFLSLLIVIISLNAHAVRFDNIRIDDNEISSVDTNGDIELNPNGSGDINASSSNITNVTDPIGAQDASTKAYTDAQDALALQLSGGTLTGSLVIQDGSEGSANDCFVSQDANGTGAWGACPSGTMNWADPVDADIIPDTDSAYDLGSNALRFDMAYIDEVLVTDRFVFQTFTIDSFYVQSTNATTPSGANVYPHMIGLFDVADVWLGSSNATGSNNSADLYLETGNSVNGNGGLIRIRPGQASGSGSGGDLEIVPDSGAITAGECLRAANSNGKVEWDDCAVKTPSSSNVTTAVAVISCSGSSSVTSQIGTWISSVGNISSGSCTVNFSGGTFTSTPICIASSGLLFGSTGQMWSTFSESTSSVVIDCKTDSGADCPATTAKLFCMGVN